MGYRILLGLLGHFSRKLSRLAGYILVDQYLDVLSLHAVVWCPEQNIHSQRLYSSCSVASDCSCVNSNYYKHLQH